MIYNKSLAHYDDDNDNNNILLLLRASSSEKRRIHVKMQAKDIKHALWNMFVTLHLHLKLYKYMKKACQNSTLSYPSRHIELHGYLVYHVLNLNWFQRYSRKMSVQRGLKYKTELSAWHMQLHCHIF